MKYHFAHLNRIDVSVGQQITKGQVIGLLGKTGTTSAHLHYEVQKIFRGVTDYTKGLSKAQVLEYYTDPYTTDWQSIIPFNNMGWDWLSDIGGGQLHPGLDLNAGIGDSDLNTPIKSPINGTVYYAADDTKVGWGKHIFIEEGDNMNGLKLWDNNGQVWAEFDGKQFYVEHLESIAGLSVVKGQPSGDILIKQKDQDTRLAEQKAGYELVVNDLVAKVEAVKKQAKIDLETCEGQRDNNQNQLATALGHITVIESDLATCLAKKPEVCAPQKSLWQLIKDKLGVK